MVYPNRREYKTAQQVRDWLKRWHAEFTTEAFDPPRGAEKLQSSVATLRIGELPYDDECCVTCFNRMAKSRRLTMCRRVLKELKDAQASK